MDKNDEILMDGIDERIESFLRGSMNAEEEAIFKQEIKSNPELRNRAMTMASLIKGIQAKEAEREKEITHSPANNSKSRTRSIIKWTCSIAAVFAIFFGIISLFQEDNHSGDISIMCMEPPPNEVFNDQLLSPYYSKYDINSITRGDVDSTKVAHLYTLFNEIKSNISMNNIIKELEPAYANIDSDYTYNALANDIAWNLALAYIKDDQRDKAILVLEKLKSDNPDTPIYKKASKLIELTKTLNEL